MSRDQTFLIVLGGLFSFMLLFGLGAVVVSLVQEPSDQVTFRIVGAIANMFAAVVGLVLGYLVGRKNGNGNGGK